MKNFFLYFSGAFYSVKECLLTWKKPKKYPIIIFFISFFMLLSPIQYNMLSISEKTLIEEIPKIEVVLKEVALDLNEKEINVKIENNKLICDSTYQKNIEGYMVVIGIDYEEYPEVVINKIQETDNIIVFGNERFYARSIERNERNVLENTRTLSGTYNLANTFEFSLIYENKDNINEIYNIVGTLLKTIFLSNSGSNLIFWVLIIEIFNLLFLLIGGFILLFFNIKGNRDYKLNYGQSFLTMMGSLIFPSLISTIIGMINFSYFTISYILLSVIRLFMLCYAQLSKNQKYNQLDIQVKDETFELKFK